MNPYQNATVEQCLEQIDLLNFKDEIGCPLSNSVAFIRLKQLASMTPMEQVKALSTDYAKLKDDVQEKIDNIEDNGGDVPFEMQQQYDLLDEVYDYLSDAIKAIDKLNKID